MPKRIALFSRLAPHYDAALRFFLQIGFECREDTDLGAGKRWVRIAPKGAETEILLAKAKGPVQEAAIGAQGGGASGCFWKAKISPATRRALLRPGQLSRVSRASSLMAASWSGLTHGAIAGT
ncbi:MAG: VOC family protein [Roseinatronobacter sp.]